MNYNKTKHRILKLFLDVRLNYNEHYHDLRESLLSVDQIVKKEKLDYDDVNVIVASLSANEEIKHHNYSNDDSQDFAGYAITNQGVFAYEDRKYLRIKTERSRATWGFVISIASFAISIIAILMTLQQPKQKTQKVAEKKVTAPMKVIDSSKLKKTNVRK